MINYTYFDLFQQDSVDKQLIIQFDNTTITNEDLFYQSLTLEESLCSEQELRFGACEASVLKFKVANIVAPMKDKWITVKMVLEGHADEPFIIGKYKVEEDKVTADRMWREIVAYDAMYDIINVDASEMAKWYNNLLPDDSKDTWVTMRSFRTSFLQYFGIEQETATLVNDYMKVERTIAPEQISGKDIITAICEINSCFGHIGRDGKFRYIYLPQDIEGLYPANDLYPSDGLFPRDPQGERVGANGTYIGQPQYENFICQAINKIQIRQEESDIGKIYPDTPPTDKDNTYIIEDNFLVYGKSSEELFPIARNILSKIANITYRPLTNADVKGNPCFEVGDPIRISTKYELVETYILERTLKGIQALRDAYSSKGVEKYAEQVNSVHKSIIQLKGKTNTITRTVEENRQEMLDIEAGLSFTIVETAKGLEADIKAEQQRAEGEETKLSNNIKVTAEGLQANITKEQQRAEGEETKLSTSITALAGKIVLKVDSNGDIAIVQLEADPDTGTVFKVKAKNISLTAAEVINLMSNGDINLTGENIKITSTNFKVDKNGNVTCKNIKCENIKAFSISTEAKSDFNSEVSDSEAMRLAREAIAAAQAAADAAASAAAKAQAAANTANTTVTNLNNTIIPAINRTINEVQVKVAALEARVAALEAKG